MPNSSTSLLHGFALALFFTLSKATIDSSPDSIDDNPLVEYLLVGDYFFRRLTPEVGYFLVVRRNKSSIFITFD